ncbi:Peptidyl-prolyl cis-trans isomerase CPR4 [Nakaseomyces bracarensis]|uniref:Peptidyl-prolyl cis-trans isomerase CPR4 n=1 Tax=Nakaseomyces bracarensis TaxID=273131 RepID=A0ABR4NM68_9SACH
MQFLALLSVFLNLFLAIHAAPVRHSKEVDTNKALPPNPPVTARVLFTFAYYPSGSDVQKEIEVAVELYGTVAPKTVKNFDDLAKGVKAVMAGDDPKVASNVKTLKFSGTRVTKMVEGQYIVGGEVLPGITTFSIYGGNWPEENFDLKFDRPGRLAMWNRGAGKQDSQYMINLGADGNPELDGRYTVFGQIVSGLDAFLDEIQSVEVSDMNQPMRDLILKYAVIESLRISNRDELHAKYLAKLQEFNSGDVSKGITLAPYMSGNPIEEEAAAQAGAPVMKYLCIIAIIAAAFFAYKRRAELLKNTNIVSLKEKLPF